MAFTSLLCKQKTISICLIILDPAVISNSPVGNTLPAGITLIPPLSCTVQGVPVPTVTWLKDGVPLVDNPPKIHILPGIGQLIPSVEFPEFGIRTSQLYINPLELRYVVATLYLRSAIDAYLMQCLISVTHT